MSEWHHQAALIEWRDRMLGYYPDLRWLHASMNGMHAGSGKAAKNSVRSGLTKGVADICLPVPQGKFHGLWAEFKDGTNELTEDQAAFLNFAREKGYATRVWRSIDAAISDLTRYLEGSLTIDQSTYQGRRKRPAKPKQNSPKRPRVPLDRARKRL